MVHVVVPLDESVVAEGAIPWAAAIARARAIGVHLVTVVPSDADYWEFAEIDPREGRGVQDRSTVHAYLETMRYNPALTGLAVTTEVREGDVAGEILACAAEPDAAMVVITTRGRGNGREGARGSVANKLIRASMRPLVVVPPEARLEGFENLLVTLDGSPAAERVLPGARALAGVLGSQVHLLHVVDVDLGWPLEEAARADHHQRLARQAKAYLGGIGVPGEVQAVTIGRPVDAILDYTGQFDCRMIAMATQGRAGMVRLELGSTADAVLRRTNRPVLLVRIPAGEDSEAGT